jgi:hypothetical protein
MIIFGNSENAGSVGYGNLKTDIKMLQGNVNWYMLLALKHGHLSFHGSHDYDLLII